MKRIAVVGSGISGLSAAYTLQKKYDITLFEAENRLGGHTHTVRVPDDSGREFDVDTGFIVLNDCNYPVLHELFERWGVKVRWSDMSFSFFDPVEPFYYAGTTLLGLFAQTKNITSPRFYSFLYEVYRFCRDAISYLDAGSTDNGLGESRGLLDDITLGEFILERRYSKDMIDCYLLPMGSAIWSVPTAQMKAFPAETFFRFFRNHGLLSLVNRPRWQTVVGGSSAYLSKFRDKFKGTIRLACPVKNVIREASGVRVQFLENGTEHTEMSFDEVVLACHANQALSLFEEPSEREVELLSPWEYQNNEVILHTDTSILPPNKHAWASWNYSGRRLANEESSPATLTYYMNLLQGLESKTNFLVTLNESKKIDPSKILRTFNYSHPVFSNDAIKSQARLFELQGVGNTYFCGSYFGNGFHEDGARSGVQLSFLKGVSL